jgi:hypothetical protein
MNILVCGMTREHARLKAEQVHVAPGVQLIPFGATEPAERLVGVELHAVIGITHLDGALQCLVQNMLTPSASYSISA